jgi:hypothetical protein
MKNENGADENLPFYLLYRNTLIRKILTSAERFIPAFCLWAGLVDFLCSKTEQTKKDPSEWDSVHSKKEIAAPIGERHRAVIFLLMLRYDGNVNKYINTSHNSQSQPKVRFNLIHCHLEQGCQALRVETSPPEVLSSPKLKSQVSFS